MACHHAPYIPIYEGDEDPRCQWFIYETIWEAVDVTKAKKIAQFDGALMKIALTWYMNFTKKLQKI